MMPPGLRLEVPPKLNAPLTGAIEYTVVQRVQQTVDVLDANVVAYAIAPAINQVVGYLKSHILGEASQHILCLAADSLWKPLGEGGVVKHETERVGLILVVQVSAVDVIFLIHCLNEFKG